MNILPCLKWVVFFIPLHSSAYGANPTIWQGSNPSSLLPGQVKDISDIVKIGWSSNANRIPISVGPWGAVATCLKEGLIYSKGQKFEPEKVSLSEILPLAVYASLKEASQPTVDCYVKLTEYSYSDQSYGGLQEYGALFSYIKLTTTYQISAPTVEASSSSWTDIKSGSDWPDKSKLNISDNIYDQHTPSAMLVCQHGWAELIFEKSDEPYALRFYTSFLSANTLGDLSTLLLSLPMENDQTQELGECQVVISSLTKELENQIFVSYRFRLEQKINEITK